MQREVRAEQRQHFAPVVRRLGDTVLEEERGAEPRAVVVQADAHGEPFAPVRDRVRRVVKDGEAHGGWRW
jgi:hypothetical protein